MPYPFEEDILEKDDNRWHREEDYVCKTMYVKVTSDKG